MNYYYYCQSLVCQYFFFFSDLKCHLYKMYSYFRDVSISELDLQLSFPIFSCQILVWSICTRIKWVEDCAHVFCSIESLMKYWPDFLLDWLNKPIKSCGCSILTAHIVYLMTMKLFRFSLLDSVLLNFTF